MTESSEDLGTEPGKMPAGCLWSLALIAVAILGLTRSCYLPGPDRQVFEVIPGAKWNLTVPTDLTSVKGLCRFEDARAGMHFEGLQGSTPVEVQCDKQDRWHDINVEIVRIKGVPVGTAIVSAHVPGTSGMPFSMPSLVAITWNGWMWM
jgi:hypothetical protein